MDNGHGKRATNTINTYHFLVSLRREFLVSRMSTDECRVARDRWAVFDPLNLLLECPGTNGKQQ